MGSHRIAQVRAACISYQAGSLVSLPPSAPRLTLSMRRLANTGVWVGLAGIIVVSTLLALAVSVDDAGNATREVLFGVGHRLRWLLYLLTAVVFVIIALGPYRRSRLWRLGRHDEKRWDRIGERAKVFLFYGIGQGRLPNDLYAGVMHLLIFWGWLVLFIGTVVSSIHAGVGYFL